MKEIKSMRSTNVKYHKMKLSGLLCCGLYPMENFVVFMVKLLAKPFKVYATSFQIVNAYYYYYFTMLDRQIVMS